LAVGVRVSEADEFDGLDLAEHDLNAYPDFQQTTIKSYHLREM
jgi:ammonia channel protein AmtB